VNWEDAALVQTLVVQEVAAGGGLKKAYLLPKDHALHIPPHVTLSRLEDQVEGLVATLCEVGEREREGLSHRQTERARERATTLELSFFLSIVLIVYLPY
jgi:hypothetical protein